MNLRRVLGWILVLGMSVAMAAQTMPETGQQLTLPDAIRRALAQNHGIKVEAYSREIARAYLLAAKGRFDPALTIGRDYAHDRFPKAQSPGSHDTERRDGYRVSVDGQTPWGLDYSIGSQTAGTRVAGRAGEFDSFNGISVTQPLLRGAGTTANLYEVRVARVDARISEWEFQQTVIDTVTRVVVAYHELLLAHEFVRVSQRSRELAADLLRENEIRVRAGGMSENQLVQARARAAARAEAIIFAERSVREADSRLRSLIGETAFSHRGPSLALEPRTAEAKAVEPADDLKAAYALRPDYQQARLTLEKREAGHAFARRELMPRLDLVASYGYNGAGEDLPASRRMSAERDYRGYSTGVVLTVPITFARERGRLRAARSERRQAEADLGRLEQEIALNLSLAAGQVESVNERVAATRTAFALASEALEDELKKLRAGTSSTFVVLSLQESVSSVELNMHRALAEQQIAGALYDREAGRTLQRHAVVISNL